MTIDEQIAEAEREAERLYRQWTALTAADPFGRFSRRADPRWWETQGHWLRAMDELKRLRALKSGDAAEGER